MAQTIHDLVQAVGGPGAGRIRAAARLMTRLENDPQLLPDFFKAVAAIGECREAPLGCLLPRVVIGITGAPGSGKSTLTDALVREYRQRHPDSRIGVIAVDPSSLFTGGAVLGDRVRMMRHATDPMVFVRSMATRGHLGGLTLGVRAVIRVMALLGCDVVMLETVGVGQSEVEVAGVADLVLVVMAPGQGDSIQLLKAGLMEIGDIFVVNKADRPDAAQLHSFVLATLKLATADTGDVEHHGHTSGTAGDDTAAGSAGRLPDDRVAPRAHLVSAVTHQGVAALVDELEALCAERGTRWEARRTRVVEQDVRDAVVEEARRRLDRALGPAQAFSGRIDEVLRGEVSVAELAQDLLVRTSRNQV